MKKRDSKVKFEPLKRVQHISYKFFTTHKPNLSYKKEMIDYMKVFLPIPPPMSPI